jgi:hypothetical protein
MFGVETLLGTDRDMSIHGKRPTSFVNFDLDFRILAHNAPSLHL